MFGFEHQWYLRTKAKKSAGNSQQWQQSTRWITEALKECTIDYTVDEEKFAYLGPYLELRLLDALGRGWKAAYLSIDLNQPERLELSFLDVGEQKQTPVMIKQSLIGSFERFVALLIEKYEGNLPLWLAPEQIKVLPVGECFEYAKEIKKRLNQEGFRVGIDYRKEPLGNKVHVAELEKVPYMLIVGEKEEKNSSLSIRSTGQNRTNGGTKIEAFLELLKEGSRQVGDRKSFES
jgi:threonyl-tRNA synthetase